MCVVFWGPPYTLNLWAVGPRKFLHVSSFVIVWPGSDETCASSGDKFLHVNVHVNVVLVLGVAQVCGA